MKRLLAALAFLAAIGLAPAHAAGPNSICYTTDNTNCIPVSPTNPFPVAASASISGFQPASTGTPISVTTGGVTGSLPTGAVVAAFNVGTTNTAYCKLGASATTSDIAIPPQSWFAFTVGAATQMTCITSTSTTTVNLVGGSGLPTGAGGGGGGSGGGGAVTMASGAVSSGAYSAGSLAAGAGVDGWDLTQGTKADAAYSGSGSASVVAALKGIYASVNGAIAAGTNIIGKVGIDQTTPGTTNNVSLSYGSAAVVDNPCQTVAKNFTPINITSTTTAQVIAPTASKKTYICSFSIQTASANNVAVVEGTGGTCGTGTAGVYGGATPGSGLNLAANEGIAMGNGSSPVLATAGTNVGFCLAASAATNLAGHVTWVQK